MLTVEFDRFSSAQTLQAIFTKIHLGYEIKSIDRPNSQQENGCSQKPSSDMWIHIKTEYDIAKTDTIGVLFNNVRI